MPDDTWIEWNRTFGELINHVYDLVGFVVEVDGKEYLIGDMNTLGGDCDDCTLISKGHVVTRYRRVEWKSR